jgi:hypothetical protein
MIENNRKGFQKQREMMAGTYKYKAEDDDWHQESKGTKRNREMSICPVGGCAPPTSQLRWVII